MAAILLFIIIEQKIKMILQFTMHLDYLEIIEVITTKVKFTNKFIMRNIKI